MGAVVCQSGVCLCFWFTWGFGGVSGPGVSRALGLAVCQGPLRLLG